jgi:hypothetical protein
MHLTNNRTVLFFIFLHISFYYLWLFLWEDHTLIQDYGGNLLSIAGPAAEGWFVFAPLLQKELDFWIPDLEAVESISYKYFDIID